MFITLIAFDFCSEKDNFETLHKAKEHVDTELVFGITRDAVHGMCGTINVQREL